VLRLSHENLARSADRELTALEQRKARRLIEERVRTRKPLAYLIHEAWLGDHRLRRRARHRAALLHRRLLRDGLRPWLCGRRRRRSVHRVWMPCDPSLTFHAPRSMHRTSAPRSRSRGRT
jgi:hypothetical protein